MLEILTHLRKYDVPFVLIGGHAVNYHGHIRATEDVDVVFLRTEQSERGLHRALVEIDARWLSDQKDSATGLEKEVPVSFDFVQRNHLMMVVTSLGYLDLFDFIPGMPELSVQELLDTAVVWRDIPIISLPWLKKLKAASGRPKDLIDLENLP